MTVTQAGHAKCWTVPVLVHGRSSCVVDLSCLPSKDSPDQRVQMPSGRASTIGLPARQTKMSCRGTCMTASCITVPVLAQKRSITYNLQRTVNRVVSMSGREWLT